jgi:hypothetical protein
MMDSELGELMKDQARHVTLLVLMTVLTLTLMRSSAYAQSTSPSGPFGFLLNISMTREVTDTGTAIIGIMNFDGAGNVAGPLIFERGGTSTKPVQSVPATLTGTYSSNPDGTGGLTVSIADQLTFTFDTVIAEGGRSLQLISTGLAGNSSRGEVLGGSARAGFVGSPKGSYAFQLTSSPVPALTIGVLSFDGAGKAVMTFKSVDSDPANPVQSSGSLAGTYDVKPDGTGTIDLKPSSGGTFAMVVTDDGSGLLLMQTDITGSNVLFGTARLQ